MDKMRMHTPDITESNIEKIGQLFPNCLTEKIGDDGHLHPAINFDILRQELSKDLVDGYKERYQFSWPDKRAAIRLANAPSSMALRPVRNKSVNFDSTENIYIEGDNLEVLKLLQEDYLGKVKFIYIDPPYNTGNNLIYKNDFHIDSNSYLSMSGQYDDDGKRLVVNPETNGLFHTDWLNMMYPRLKIAKNLLSKDGVLACAIDENEFATLSMMLKEIWGEMSYCHSYVSVVHNPRGQQGNNFSYVNEYLIFVYPNDKVKYLADFPKDEVDSRNLRDSGTESDRTDARNCFYPFIVMGGQIIDIGEVPANDFHPASANVRRSDGSIEVWPMTDSGDEKKWRYARQSVEDIREQLEAKTGRNSIQIIFNKSEGTMRSVWANARYDASEYGTKLVERLLGCSSFTYPKSLWAVYDAVKAATKNDKEALILDFFSGSGTTAHAVMQLNHDDGGHRKFLMVQVPEKIPSEYQNARFRTICDIGIERIRLAGEEISDNTNSGNAGLFDTQTQPIDTGFRVLKLDSSNMEDVYYKPEDSSESTLFEDNVKPDRSGEDLLFQVMLECTLPLSAKIQTEKIAGKEVFSVNNGYLIACFDEDVNEEVITAVAKRKPYYFIMRDKSLSSDNVADNFEQIFQAYSKDTIRRIL
jgi:adenine-specific DNA-methyltransferase